MDTLIVIEAVPEAAGDAVRPALLRALRWFTAVERACSRFDPGSEVRRLLPRTGVPVPVSPVLYEALRFAAALAARTRGAFDPTVGDLLERQGFDRHYVTGARRRTPVPPAGGAAGRVSYRDLRFDPRRRTVTLRRPLVLDLGAVAKGLAVDLAARELAPYRSVCIDAGGDLFARGRNPAGRPWRVGVQDPRRPDALIGWLDVRDGAVCTSGDYERRTPDGAQHHLVDPRTGRSAGGLASATVVAPTATAADGLATAAFVLGPERGLRLLRAEGVEGLLVTPSGELLATAGLRPPRRGATSGRHPEHLRLARATDRPRRRRPSLRPACAPASDGRAAGLSGTGPPRRGDAGRPRA
jgi:thiamine biosynthesis lipoprotein